MSDEVDVSAVRVRVGANVRQLRHLRNLSQEQLAEMVGNNPRHIGQVERGEANVTLDILTAIAAKLDVDITELFHPTTTATGEPFRRIAHDDVEQLAAIVERIKRGLS
jgi:transcriptional regulator with XRE-family HTH domain